MKGVFKTVTFMVLIFAVTVVFAEDYDVGDDAEWSRPTDAELYTTWATGKTFRVGDELEFEFAAGRHDVAVVTQDAYENCEKEKPISLLTTPPVKIRLNKTGPHYFICTIAEHCRFGQKLAINVVGAGGRGGGGGGGGGGATTPTTPAGSPPGTVGGFPPTSPEAGITPPVSGGATPETGATTPTGSSGTTTRVGGSSDTTTTIPAGSGATSLGGATILVAFVFAIVALF
ncbi:unnamed protein product [Cochlearia groenlandica]